MSGVCGISLTIPITPTQKTVAIMLSAAFPPSFSMSVPMLLHIELSEATAPNVSSLPLPG